ncbi:MAG: sialate O-acetylesterase, partial [Steroidobacteraceae bacterium]
MQKIAALLAVTLASAFCGNSAQADVILPHILSSHAVLQRNRPIHLWGWAAPGEAVVVSLHGVKEATRADEMGDWSVYLPPEPAGGPYTLTVSGTNRIVLSDLMVGDVWFASGQSNMQLPLEGFPGSAVVKNGAEEIANAAHPDLRLLHFPDDASPYPQEDQSATWTLCTPKTAATFSAVAYFFAREIAQREHVTVGIIDSSWGGTPGEAWISMDTLGADAALMPVFAAWARVSDASVAQPRLEAAWKRQAAADRAAGERAPWHPWQPDDLKSWEPSWLYDGMVAPAINFPIRGVIWYQGAQNTPVERAALYQRIFPALIRDWRAHWREGNFPFLFVQLANFTSVPAED